MRLFSYRAFGEDKQMLALLCRRCSSRLAAVHPDSKLNNGLFSHSQSVKMSEKFVYRLCGLSAALHMRPTSFQAPLPATRVCSVCGVVPEKIALLPCCHPVCQCCFEVFVSKENICSLDEKRFKEEQVEWLEFSEKQLTGHLAFCWNADVGCEFLGPVMSLPYHYHGECLFHVVPCPRCKLPVLRSNIAKHCSDDCDPHRARYETTKEQSPRVLWDVTRALEKVSVDNDTLQTSVNVLVESIRTECSSIRESLSAEAVRQCETSVGISDLQKDVNRMVGDIKECLKEYLNNEIDALSKIVLKAVEDNARILRRIHCPNQLHWYLNEWSELKAKAAANGMATAESSVAFMHGYNVVHVVQVNKNDAQLNVGTFLRLAKGDQDTVLEWPFRKTYKLSVIHPQETSKTLSHTVNASEYPSQKTFHRPKDIPSPGYGTAMLSTVATLDNGGYVTDDTLHLCLEILP